MSSLPLTDPQFWLVTAGAVGALLYLGRKRLRIRKKGTVALPCDNCAQNGTHNSARRRAPSPKRG